MKGLVVVVVAVCVVAAAPAQAAKKKALPTAAVLEFEGLAPVADKDAVEEALRGLLPASGYVVQKKEKTEQTLKAVLAIGLACDAGDIDCLIRIGALGGAAVVLKGVLSVSDADKDALSLDLVGVDVNGLRERGRVRVTLSRDPAVRQAAIESALVGVLRPEVWRGLLRVSVGQRGASIVVDGVPRGFAPLSQSIELTPGTHALFVGLEGFRAHKADVVIAYDQELVVDVALVPGVSEPAPTFTTKKEPAQAEKPPEPPPPPPPSKKKPLRIVLYDVETAGVDPRTAQVIGSFLVAELRKREFVSVLDSGELRALVGDGTTTKGDVRGCSDDQCFAEVADSLGADGVVVSQLTQVGGETLFGLRRIDQQKQEVTASFLERVPAQETQALLPLVGKSIAATFGEIPLRSGQTAGVDANADKVLNPPPLPPLLSGSLYAGAVVAGTTGVVLLGVSVASWLSYQQHLDALRDKSVPGTPDDNAVLTGVANRFEVSQLGGYIALGAGAALAIAAVSTGAATDWDGYAQQAKSP